ncbi:DUF6745 domain-containing protein [Dactylosporangium siamense]|uniref:DUF6745 domain-containing protein n=1 Tax=Dactylosporangium siamense TaxID=685454 RepID=UPI0019417744|nr:hypothetical protein [Dactylosporangium siamense]
MHAPSSPGRRAWESAARACYRELGVPFPDRVVWVPSPLTGALAAPIAAGLNTGHRNRRVLESVYRAVDDSAGRGVGDAVRAAVGAATDGSVHDPVHGAAATALHTSVTAVIGAATGSATPRREPLTGVLDVVFEATDAAVRAAVDAAVGGPLQDTLRGHIRTLWQAHLPGRRHTAWLRLVDQCWPDGPPPEEDPPSTRDGWWWWPFRHFVMLCPPPAELHLEPDPRMLRRPHRADGPAVVWADGFGLHYWHGVHVPRAVIDDAWSTEEILREPNAEVRRCAIERRGWDRFVADAGLAQIGPPADDPGNPGQTLTLHDVPSGIFTNHVRVLLCTNGTVERDGTRRRFGLTVPANCDDPITAAAWTYGLTPAQYATAQRRT